MYSTQNVYELTRVINGTILLKAVFPLDLTVFQSAVSYHSTTPACVKNGSEMELMTYSRRMLLQPIQKVQHVFVHDA